MSTRLHRSEVRHQLGRLARAGGPNVPQRAIESALGYPLAEAGMDDLRGVIAALTVVTDATCSTTPAAVGAPGPVDAGEVMRLVVEYGAECGLRSPLTDKAADLINKIRAAVAR